MGVCWTLRPHKHHLHHHHHHYHCHHHNDNPNDHRDCVAIEAAQKSAHCHHGHGHHDNNHHNNRDDDHDNNHHNKLITIMITITIRNSVAMEAEKKAAALKAAALVDKPPHALIAVNIDSREAELSWLGTWLVYFLVATVEIIISAANTTFN